MDTNIKTAHVQLSQNSSGGGMYYSQRKGKKVTSSDTELFDYQEEELEEDSLVDEWKQIDEQPLSSIVKAIVNPFQQFAASINSNNKSLKSEREQDNSDILTTELNPFALCLI